MSPSLATESPTPTTRDLPAPLAQLLAELAIAEKWPTTADWCHRCGRPSDDGHFPRTCEYSTQPITRERWIDMAAYRALVAAGLFVDDDELSSAERRAQRAVLSPLVYDLGEALITHARITAA